MFGTKKEVEELVKLGAFPERAEDGKSQRTRFLVLLKTPGKSPLFLAAELGKGLFMDHLLEKFATGRLGIDIDLITLSLSHFHNFNFTPGGWGSTSTCPTMRATPVSMLLSGGECFSLETYAITLFISGAYHCKHKKVGYSITLFISGAWNRKVQEASSRSW